MMMVTVMRLRGLALLLLLLGLGGCASYLRLEAPPPVAAEAIPVLGVANSRFWLDGAPDALIREAALMAEREARVAPGGALQPQNFLALSGGGDNGAFGAGFMVGWTAAGTRPQFNVVTGISAGALIAPFAFLGPDYDPALREVFTGVLPRDVLILPRQAMAAFALFFGEALADTSPLSRLINRNLNEEMLAAIARDLVTTMRSNVRVDWSRREDVRAAKPLRPDYAENAGALTAASQVVAINFATVAQANNYWR